MMVPERDVAGFIFLLALSFLEEWVRFGSLDKCGSTGRPIFGFYKMEEETSSSSKSTTGGEQPTTTTNRKRDSSHISASFSTQPARSSQHVMKKRIIERTNQRNDNQTRDQFVALKRSVPASRANVQMRHYRSETVTSSRRDPTPTPYFKTPPNQQKPISDKIELEEFMKESEVMDDKILLANIKKKIDAAAAKSRSNKE